MEVIRTTAWGAGAESILRNVRFALRTFRRQPGAHGFAILVLACGIAVSTAVFSLVQAVLLQPLPFPNQNSIAVIWKTDRKADIPLVEMAYPELSDLQNSVPAFASVAVMPTTLYGYGKVIQVDGHAPLQEESAPVSHDFFRTLGVTPALGRDFNASDEHVGAAPVVILNHRVWREQFGARPDAVGRLIQLNGTGYRVIGIMARDVDFPRGAGLWVPLGVSAMAQQRGATYLQAVARLRPGYTLRQASSQTNAILRRRAAEFPQFYLPFQESVITSLPRYWAGSARVQLIFSLGAAFLLLITACITAGNLFLSRILTRKHEIATRSSLGAGAVQIASQFLIEGFTAAAIAGVIGSALAWVLVRALVFLAPADIPRLASASISFPVLAFALIVSILTALGCSMLPAFLAARAGTEVELRAGSSRLTMNRAGRRLQNLFTAGQITVTLILLTASVLIVISVRRMLTAPIGFAHRDAVTLNLALRGEGYSAERRGLFYTRLLENLRKSPGIAAAGAVLLRPFEGTIGWDSHYRAAFNRDRRFDELPIANLEVVTPGYFSSVGIPLLDGRDFSTVDSRDAAPAVILSRSLADRFRRIGLTPIGQRIQLGRSADNEWLQVVGIVGDTRDRSVTTSGDDIYLPYLQTEIPVNYLAVRGRDSPAAVVSTVRREVAALDPNQALAGIASLGELVDRNTARQRFNMALLITFGLGALLLAAAGVYSVVAESVSVRTREIAIHMALGATRQSVVRRLSSTSLAFVFVGECIGLAAVLSLSRVFSGLLYGIGARDPRVLASVGLFLFAIACAAASWPALRATRQSPADLLR